MSGTEQPHSRTVRRYVLEGERVVVEARRHWASILEPVASAVVAFVLAGVVATALEPSVGAIANVVWILWLAVALRAGWRLLEWRFEWFVATDKRLLLVYGLFIQRVAMMPMGKVTDMNYGRSLMGQVFGYGEFVLESAGQDQALHRIRFVDKPDATYRALCTTLFGKGSRHHLRGYGGAFGPEIADPRGDDAGYEASRGPGDVGAAPTARPGAMPDDAPPPGIIVPGSAARPRSGGNAYGATVPGGRSAPSAPGTQPVRIDLDRGQGPPAPPPPAIPPRR
ncbi:PH domain-containing protein [Cellulomonas sp. PhB143]|uniref:PH domain-containing protein n=1 Tax=Cellulomonas sp. PhB143 TaxID=2485186 RepID=UPI000F490FCE|nr:PH domain-containing protein [Cellulomonas sp. PhB143]ROS73549.1 PH (Pleckstrin Homology) domain-containing protein [Cellulomonas sp. PhB143]